MKTTNQILILLAVLSLMSCGQLHVVTLYVDTNGIPSSSSSISSDSLNQYASFDQPVGIENKNFITNVRKWDRIIWQGQSISDSTDIVKITSISIKPEEGKPIFVLKPFKPIKVNGDPVNITGSDELVRGKVKLGPGRDEAYIIQEYSLEFTVTGKGTFTIDPVVRAHQ